MARPSKPSALKLVEGNRGKRATAKQEPDPTYLEDLAPPAWLNPAAAAVWDELAPRLRSQRLLTVVDIDALALGCVALAQFRAAHNQLDASLVKPSKPGDAMTGAEPRGEHLNPWLVVQSMAFKQAMTVLREFGMSPAARTRIAIQPQGDLFDDRQGGAAGNGYF